MPRRRPNQTITSPDQIATPGRMGFGPIVHNGREFRAFPPVPVSVHAIASRIIRAGTGYRAVSFVLRQDPYSSDFEEGGFASLQWFPQVLEIRLTSGRIIAAFRIACCKALDTNGNRDWNAIGWMEEIGRTVRDMNPPFRLGRFRRHSPASAHRHGRAQWVTSDSGEVGFGWPQQIGGHAATNESPNQSRRRRRNADRPATFTDVARSMGLGR